MWEKQEGGEASFRFNFVVSEEGDEFVDPDLVGPSRQVKGPLTGAWWPNLFVHEAEPEGIEAVASFGYSARSIRVSSFRIATSSWSGCEIASSIDLVPKVWSVEMAALTFALVPLPEAFRPLPLRRTLTVPLPLPVEPPPPTVETGALRHSPSLSRKAAPQDGYRFGE